MKKNYISPSIMMLAISQQSVIMTSGDTDTLPYYTDDPQKPGNALSRRRSKGLWDDEEEDENEY